MSSIREKIFHSLDSLDKSYFWHPFTQMQEYEQKPSVIIEKANGIYLYDQNGKPYIDGISSWWVNIFGHNNERLNNALIKQIKSFSHVSTASITHEPAIKLAYELCQILPQGLSHVFYSDDGSTAVETALKMAFQYNINRGKPHKQKFIALQHAYHGDTLGAVSVGDVAIYHNIFKPLLFDVHHVISPAFLPSSNKMDIDASTNYSWANKCILELETYLSQNSDSIAAFIIEPIIQAAAGMYIYSAHYLKKVRELCSKYDVLLIADEVAVGFGRTGKIFACNHSFITPDIICLSKALTGGYMPMGVTVATDEIYYSFYGKYTDNKTFFHGHSYTGNPLGCALSLEVISIFKEENIMDRVQILSNELQTSFSKLEESPFLGDYRGIGMISAIELYSDKDKKTRFDPQLRIPYKICQQAMNDGLYIRPLGDVLYLLPPLSITDKEIKTAIDLLKNSVEHVTSKF